MGERSSKAVSVLYALARIDLTDLMQKEAIAQLVSDFFLMLHGVMMLFMSDAKAKEEDGRQGRP